MYVRTYVRISSDDFIIRSLILCHANGGFLVAGNQWKYVSMPKRVLTCVRTYAPSLHVRTYIQSTV